MNSSPVSLDPATPAYQLPLTEKSADIVQNQIIFSDFKTITNNALSVPDLINTVLLRYEILFKKDIMHQTQDIDTVVQFLASHSVAGGAYSLGNLAGALANGYHSYQRQAIARHNKDYYYLYQHYLKLYSKNALATLKQPSSAQCNQAQADADKQLNELFQAIKNHGDLTQRYAEISINHDQQLLTLIPEDNALFKQKTQKKPPLSTLDKFFKFVDSKIVTPIWELLGLSSFAYWIMWISASAITGQFVAAGIAGLPAVLAFGIPLLIGCFFAIFKGCHFLYRRFQTKLKVNAQQGIAVGTKDLPESEIINKLLAKDASTLMHIAILHELFKQAREKYTHALKKQSGKASKAEMAATLQATHTHARQPEVTAHDPIHAHKTALSPSFSLDKEILEQVGSKKIQRTAVTFLASILSNFVLLQYIAWIITDMLRVLFNIITPGIEIISGVAMMLLAAGQAIYIAYQRWQGLARAEQKVKQLAQSPTTPLATLERQHASLAQELVLLEKKINGEAPIVPHYQHAHFFENVERTAGPTQWTNYKKIAARSYEFLSGALTGIFFARLFIVSKTAIILPFAAASLSTPVTIGILAAAGLVYGLFKLYQYHQKRKEERALILLKNREQRIDCLEKEIELMTLKKELLLQSQAQHTVSATPTPEHNSRSPVAPKQAGTITSTHGSSDFFKSHSIAQELAPQTPRSSSSGNEGQHRRLTAAKDDENRDHHQPDASP